MKKEVRGLFDFLQCGGVERDVQQGTKKGESSGCLVLPEVARKKCAFIASQK
jgi:hypothetical protein